MYTCMVTYSIEHSDFHIKFSDRQTDEQPLTKSNKHHQSSQFLDQSVC